MVEFFAEQDSYGGRREFLAKIYEDNMLGDEAKASSITSCVMVKACSTSAHQATAINFCISQEATAATEISLEKSMVLSWFTALQSKNQI